MPQSWLFFTVLSWFAAHFSLFYGLILVLGLAQVLQWRKENTECEARICGSDTGHCIYGLGAVGADPQPLSGERLDGSWEKVLSHSFSSTIPTLPKACVQSVALQQSQDLPGLHEELFVCLSPQL